MKKILVLLAVFALPFALLHAQEADEPGTGAELTFVPRLDIGHPLDLGNSSVYSFFDGNLTDNLSFSACNHWASFALADGKFDSDALKDLYKYTWRSDWTNWCDWAYLDYSLGNFDIMLGKFTMAVGGIEFDADDVECHKPLMSSLWSNFSPYQWGGAIGWTNDSESTNISAEIVTSPYGEKPFGSGLYSYGLKWTGAYGPVYNIWSVSHINTGDGYFTIASLGQTFAFSDALSFSLDWSNAICDEDDFLVKGNTAYASFNWTPSDDLEVIVKGGYENAKNYDDNYAIGCAANWLPLKENKNLRLHGNLAYRNYGSEGEIFAYVGIMYYLNFHIGR